MFLSKASEYAIKATIYIASKSVSDSYTNLNEVAEAIGSPAAYTAKILQDLVKHKILHSVRGAHGGFFINKNELENINLLNIVVSIDGPEIFTKCVLGLNNCSSSKPCPLHKKYALLREFTTSMLVESKIENLAKEFNINNIVLTN